MNLRWSRARALLVGVALIVATNAVVLAGVAYNRSGEPEAVLQLTERELQLYNWSWPENENSSIDVHLSWRLPLADTTAPNGRWYTELSWLQPAQLQALGFDISGNLESDEDSRRVSTQPSRRVWLVLEYDGPAYQAALARARAQLDRASSLAQTNAGDAEFERRLAAAQRQVVEEESVESRLFVVDAARDADELRARYPNRRQHVIVRGRLDIDVQGPEGQRRPVARVSDIDVDAIRVPHAFRDDVEPLTANPIGDYYNRRAPRFAATVHFGRRHEPWIVALQPLPPTQP